MKSVNSISGGKTSSYIAMHYPADFNVFSLVCIDDYNCKPKDNAIISYANRKLSKFADKYGEFIATAEDDNTLKALMDLEQLMGKEITWIRGKSFDEVVNGRQTRLPSWARRYCTTEMKMQPIFEWWFIEIGEKCEMRIGFRFDEFKRMERFVNNAPNKFSIPISCATYGQRQQKHQEYDWRYCAFPLIQNAITKPMIDDYWNSNGWLGGNLFEESRQIKFPLISNCIGCFHKKPETLCIMANKHPEKMQWFANQENLNKGTWLDSKIKYQLLIEHSKNHWNDEMLKEFGASCDSGGCTD